MTPEERLEKIREKIDEIDDNILGLLANRDDLVEEVARVKGEGELEIQQSARFQAMIERLQLRGEELGLSSGLVAGVWNVVHEQSILRQQKMNGSDPGQIE